MAFLDGYSDRIQHPPLMDLKHQSLTERFFRTSVHFVSTLWQSIPARVFEHEEYRQTPMRFRSRTAFSGAAFGVPETVKPSTIGQLNGFSRSYEFKPVVEMQLKGLISEASSFTKPFNPLFSIRLKPNYTINHFVNMGQDHVPKISKDFKPFTIVRDITRDKAAEIMGQYEGDNNLALLLGKCEEVGTPNLENIQGVRDFIETHVPLKQGRIDPFMQMQVTHAIQASKGQGAHPS